MSRHLTRAIIALLAIPVVFAGCESGDENSVTAPTARIESAVPSAQNKVVVLVIDGPRYTETFGDSLHTYIPQLWNNLRPQGTMFTNFRNNGQTVTVGGHSSIITGTWQFLNNEGLERPTRPTMFEYFRAASGAPQSDAYVVSGKTKLSVCTYSTDSTYGAPFGATEDVDFPSDLAVYDELIAVLSTNQPRLVLASLPQVDQKGHSGVWQDYLDAIALVDSLVSLTWDFLETDPFYAGQTYLFITADHGRHDDANGGFKSHGDDCEGCRHLHCLVLGPDIQAGHTVTNMYDQRDVCTTVGQIMNFATPLAEGHYIGEMFEWVTTGVVE